VAVEKKKITQIYGRTGLNRYGGHVYEELHPKLRGTQAIKIYQEMRDNDAIVGAFLFLIKMLVRQSTWTEKAASEDRVDVDAAQFLAECRADMSHTWGDLISEVLSMLWAGWSFFEIVYKRRGGPTGPPESRSVYTDNKIGWRKIEIRSQETLSDWEFDLDDGSVTGMWQSAPPTFERVFIPIEKALLFRTETTKGNPEGRSILRNAYRSWFFVKRFQELEAIAMERDATGLTIMEVPLHIMTAEAGSTDAALRAEFETMISEIKRDEREGLVIPAEEYTDDNGTAIKTGYKFRLATSGGQRQVDSDKPIKRYETRIAMSVLAEFMFLGTDKVGSFALSSDKTELFGLAISAWLDMIASIFNRFAIPRLFALNNMKLEKLPTLVPGPIEKPALEAVGNYVANLAKVGIITPDPVLETEMRRMANLPEPEQVEVL